MPDTYNFFDWETSYPELATALDPDVVLNCNDEFQQRKLHNRVSAGDIDLKPDIFYFNFPGGSGSFIFDKDKNLILRDRTDLLIEPSWTGNDLTNFVITTVDGISYRFGTYGGETAVERTEHTSGVDDIAGSDPDLEPEVNPKYFSFNSAWYLISVSSPGNAEEIIYSYQTRNQTTPYALPINIENDNSVTCSQDPETNQWTCSSGSFGNGTPEETNPKIFDRRFLTSIELSIGGYPTERIDFASTYSPPDPTSPTTNGMILDHITISRRWQNTAFQSVKRYNFNSLAQGSTGRLTLMSLQEVGFDEQGDTTTVDAPSPYTFQYYGGTLPPFLSNAIDMWGYYNGAGSNENLVHKLVPTYDDEFGMLHYNGANRRATGNTTGVLESITYPTGGSTTFKYDSHQAANLPPDYIHNFGTAVGGLRLRQIIDSDGLGGTALTRTFLYKTETGEESGVLMNNPVYYKGSSYTTSLPPGTGNDPDNPFFYGTRYSRTIFAYNASSFGTIQGNHIGYTRVEEIIGSIGKNVYHYKATPNGRGWDPTDGRLLKKQVFGSASAQVEIRSQPVQTVNLERLDREEIYTYGGSDEDFNPLTFFVLFVESDDEQDSKSLLCQTVGTPGVCDPNNQYEWRHTTGSYDPCPHPPERFRTRFNQFWYSLSTTWTRPTQTTTTDYFYDAVPEDIVFFNPATDEIPDDWNDYFFTSNGRSVSQTTDYEYDRTDLTLATAVSRNNSDGTIFRTEYEYFANANGSIRAIPSLITHKADGATFGGTRSVLDFRGWPQEIYELTDGGGEVLRATINSYTTAGRPQSFQYMNFPAETYTWTQNLVTQRDYGSWAWTYDYNEKRLLTNQVEIDGQEIDYTYDPYNRLKVLSARQGSITKEYDYLYGGPNEVVETTTYTDAPTQIVQNQFDGLGRPVGTIVNGVTKNQIFYDSDGRISRQTYIPGTFTEMIYEQSPLNRLLQEIYPDGNSVGYVYDAKQNHYIQQRINEREYATISWTDLLGRNTRIMDAINGVTDYTYDPRGNVLNIGGPAGSYSYAYDNRFRLVSKTVPGAAAMSYCYDDASDLLCSSTDGNGNKLTTEYDQYGRELAVYFTADSGVGNCDCASTGAAIIQNVYDEGGGIYTGKLKRNTTQMVGGSGQVITNYTLDDFGRVDFETQDVTVDGVSFDYTMDPELNDADWLVNNSYRVISTQNFGGGYGESFSYDDFGRVTRHSAHGISTQMRYNDADQMLFKIYDDNLQRQDYQYNIRGWLTDINIVRPEVLRQSDGPADPTLCEPETGEDDSYVVTDQVSALEFFELLCSGEDITIPGLDTCIVADPPEEECTVTLKNFHLWYLNQEVFGTIPDDACDKYGEKVTPGIQRFSLDKIYVNIPETGFTVAPLAYPYNFHYRSFLDTLEEQRLVTDLKTWMDSIQDLAYPYDSIYIRRTGKGNLLLHVDSSSFVTFAFGEFTQIIDCCEEGYKFCGVTGFGEEKHYLGESSYKVTVNFDKYEVGEADCLEPGDGNPSPPAGLPNGELSPNPTPPQLPTVLHEVILGNEQKAWYFTEELASIPGPYVISKQLAIDNPNMIFKVTAANGQQQQANLSQLQALRYSTTGIYEITIADEGSSTPIPNCPPTPPGCDDAVAAQQLQSLDEICANTISAIREDKLDPPYIIALIQLCDGSYTYVLNDFVTDIYGGYNILDTIIVDEDDLIDVEIRNEEMRFAMHFTHQPNGNIERMKWKVSNRATDIYDFSYDPLDRVVQADYAQEYYQEEVRDAGTPTEHLIRRYVFANYAQTYSTAYSYDGGGNITSIFRNGIGNACVGPEGTIDDLTLTYGGLGGQQLQTVTDAAPETLRPFGFKPFGSPNPGSLTYTYDLNGNMTRDPHKDLDFVYNFLNLPEQVNGPDTDVGIVYDAGGRKWKKEASFEDEQGNTINRTTLYVGAFEFEQTPQHPLRLHSINGHEDGREVKVYNDVPGGDIPSRLDYYHKDHLGNVRLTFSDINQDGAISVGSIYDPNNEIVLEKHYYPFGLDMTGAWFATVAPDNAYKYNHKELDKATGLYDYGARYYDPAIARWGQVDPHSENYSTISAYSYVVNNPLLFVDPNGKDHIFYLVVQKGSDVDLEALQFQVQLILDLNEINLQAQVITVGDEGFGDADFKSALDKTDALTFIGSEDFVESIYDDDIPTGIADERVGYVNLDKIPSAAAKGGRDAHFARLSIHEGVGHVFAGSGHPTEGTFDMPSRYRPSKGGSDYETRNKQNVMTRGKRTIYRLSPYITGSAYFLPEDRRAITGQIPNELQIRNPLTGRNYNSSYDNFSKRMGL
ncbi:MAG: RHS repeat-associated core domain-containing protein [Bacteroidota bacterium]